MGYIKDEFGRHSKNGGGPAKSSIGFPPSHNDPKIIQHAEKKEKAFEKFKNKEYFDALRILMELNIPRDDVIENNIAECNYKLKRYKEALRWFQSIYTNSQNPKFKFKSMERAGVCHYLLNDNQSAKTIIEKAIEEADNEINNTQNEKEKGTLKEINANSCNSLAWILSHENKFDDAKNWAKKATTLVDNEPAYADTYGFILLKLKKMDEAEKQLDIGKKSGNPFALYHYGLYYFEKGELRESMNLFDKALEKDPNFAEAYDAKAVIHAKLGDSNQAIKFTRKALSLKPNLVKAHENLIKLTQKTNSRDRFWDFWAKTSSRKAAAITLSFFAIAIVLLSIDEPNINKVTVEQLNTTNGKIVGNVTTTTTTTEPKIPDSYLIIIGIIVMILLSPEITKAKIGILELEMAKDPPPIK